MGPPSSGGVAVLQILGMLERFPPSQLQPNTLSEVHLFTQASRLAFADRAMYLGDPDVIHVPVAGLLDKGYLAQRSALIDPAKDMGTAIAGTPPQRHAEFAPQKSQQLPGTSHLSAVDDHGQVVSMTMTVEFVFGSEVMANGFFLNNELTDFSFDPTRDGKPVANAPAPGKRPMSAMSPTIVFGPDGKFAIATGSPGGPAIIDYVAQSLIAMIDGGMGAQDAAALPHPLNLNSPTILEKGTPLDVACRATHGDGSHGQLCKSRKWITHRPACARRLCRRSGPQTRRRSDRRLEPRDGEKPLERKERLGVAAPWIGLVQSLPVVRDESFAFVAVECLARRA